MQVLGISVDGGVVYQAMITYPEVGLSELGLWLAWPEGRLRRALGELERLSLIRPGWERQDRAQLVDPAEALPVLLEEQELALRQRAADVARSRSLVAGLVSEYQQARSEQGQFPHQHVFGQEAVQGFATGLAESCGSEMVSFSPAGPPAPPHDEPDRKEDIRLLERGVRIRRVYLESIVNNADAVNYARWLVEAGGEVRTVPSLPVRMSVYDRAVAIVAIDPQHSEEGIMVLRGTGVLVALCSFFDHVWDSAGELGMPVSRDQVGLTAQGREVLRLLADGDTDAVVARKLGVSVRTARRVIAELADRLDARSRFQFGARAVQTGWLSRGEGPSSTEA